MEFETKVQFLTQPEHNRRTIVISDIHGHRAWLEKLLKKVDFSEKDILIIVGDMIEKGPESLNTIRYIMELCEKYTVYPMMGNVDLWRIQMLLTEDGSLDQELYETNERMRQYWKATFFQDFCRYLFGESYHSGSFLVAHLCGDYAVDLLQGFFHSGLAVTAHHSFYF